MKVVDGWWMPESETSGFTDIKREWKIKGASVLSRVPRLRTCIQAGGNLGIFPKELAKHFHQVYTFEPVYEIAECLYRNTFNVENITRYEVALGAESGKVSVERTLQGNCGATRLKLSEKGSMSIRTIDSYSFENVDLMWLDLEGFEVKALLGARETIEAHSPVLVVENNGLIHEFRGTVEGSIDFRNWMREEFGYVCVDRLMRDDIFIKEK